MESEDLDRERVTDLLCSPDASDEARAEALWSAIYASLHQLAGRKMAGERRFHTLQPTALVHEAFIRLVDAPRVDWQGRSHFLGIAARVMRQVLVDHSRRRNAAKRGGDWQRVTMNSSAMGASEAIDFLDLNTALEKLKQMDESLMRLIELRFFAGLTVDEAAKTLNISPRKAAKDWAAARLWLKRELERAS